MKGLYIKHLLFGFIMLLLLMPLAQSRFDFPKIKPLKGYFLTHKKPVATFANYLNGSLQDSLNRYIEQNIGFRPDLVRLHNQFRYSLFDTVSAAGVIKGKNGYLFELNYIKAFYGLDFVGYDTLRKHMEQTVAVNDWLQKQGKHLIVFLAPGKGTYFSDYLPDGYKTDSLLPTNENIYYESLKQYHIPVISGNRLFAAVRDTCRYALFPQCGIHWSYYGLGVAFDTLLDCMNQLNGRDFVDFTTKNIVVTNNLRSPDRDLWEGLNIFSKPNDQAMPYPVFEFVRKTPDSMPSVIVVADSYYWQWFGGGYANQAFGKHDFWYYNMQIFGGEGNKEIQRQNVDILTRVLEADFIILLQTDANMSRYSFGFIPQLYDAIQKARDLDKAAMDEIRQTIVSIRNSPDYMELIKEKAEKRKITVDEMLRLDAIWIYENKHNLQ